MRNAENYQSQKENFALIEIKHLTKQYGKNIAVNDLSFTVESGLFRNKKSRPGGWTALLRILRDCGDPLFHTNPPLRSRKNALACVFFIISDFLPMSIRLT